VVTPGGTVSADVIVRATEGFTPQFREHRRTLVPLYSLVLATEPLPAELRESLGLTHRAAFNDMRHLRIYAQTTSDGRIVFGGRGAPYHFGSKVCSDYDTNAAIHAKIYSTLLDFFPSLRGIRVTHWWGGPLGVPRDWHPSIGFDARTGQAWAGPYVGDGVTTSNLAGRVLRNLILKQDEDINRLPVVNHRSPRWEPEPLRWAGVNLGLRAAALADTEERATGRPSRVAQLLESMTGAH
jgi:glycine/D-amino acid oxidase-like deaminating enzyme